ncbi:MAG: ABC transporter permease subunit [Bradymonadales bacterium]|nr:ABC transporter permease subunit [Bradymonadales bacterium]
MSSRNHHPKPPGVLLTVALMSRLYWGTVLRSRKALASAAITLAVVVTAALFARWGAGSDRAVVYASLLRQFPLGILLQLAALLAGTAVVREEVESATLTYLLVRPIRRRTILGGRWLTATMAVMVLMAVVCLVLHVIAAPAGLSQVSGLPSLLWTTALGAVYYTTAFTAFGVLFRRPLAWGLGYILFWELALPLVPSSAAMLSLRFHLLNLAGLSQATERPAFLAPPDASDTASIVILLGATLLFAVISLWQFPRREYLGKTSA